MKIENKKGKKKMIENERINAKETPTVDKGDNFSPTDEQLAVINSTADNIVVTAGAGTGKTATMVRRIKHLIETDDEIRSGDRKILYITFTNKAAESQTEKLNELLNEDDVDKVLSTTIHKFILKEVLNGKKRLQLMSENDLISFILSYIDITAKDIQGKPNYKKQLQMTFFKHGKYNSAIARDSALRISNYMNLCLLQRTEGSILSSIPPWWKEAREKVKLEYGIAGEVNGELQRSSLTTLSKIVCDAHRYLKDEDHKEILAALQHKYKYLIVDEFQDINMLMYKLFDLFDKVTVVGDKKQAIYGFNGGDPKYFDMLMERKGAKHYSLSRNFRSTKTILKLPNSLFSKEESLHTDKIGNSPKMYIVEDDKAAKDKLLAVVDELTSSGNYQDGQIMVLNKRNKPLVDFQKSLNSETCRSYVKGDKATDAVTGMILAWGYLKHLYDELNSNPNNPNNKNRFKTNLKYRLGEFVHLKNRLVNQQTLDLLTDSLMPDNIKNDVDVDFAPIRAFLTKCDFDSCFELYQYVANNIIPIYTRSEYLNSNIDGNVDVERILDDIKTTLVANNGVGCTQYDQTLLEDLYFYNALDKETPVNETDQIKLMTIHKSKGLEAPVVIVVDTPKRGTSDADRENPIEQHKQKSYVALTRAKDEEIIICNKNSDYYRFKGMCEVVNRVESEGSSKK